MIYVGGVPFASDDSSQGIDILFALMEHPILVSVSNSVNSMQEEKISVSENSKSVRSETSKWVYIFQREFATVDPALVDLVGTDEATTCVGVAIRNLKTGMISVSHMDSPEVVEGFWPRYKGSDQNRRIFLSSVRKDNRRFGNRNEKFQIQTLHVLRHNTKWDSEGIARPIFHGFVVETSSGSIIPASFDGTSRSPDDIVRRIQVTAAFEDPNWTGKLLDTYDTSNDQFVIAPCAWSIRQKYMALALQNLSDTEILLSCSSSPYAEGPEFVDKERRKWDYLIKHPNWRRTFPSMQPRVFQRTADAASWV